MQFDSVKQCSILFPLLLQGLFSGWRDYVLFQSLLSGEGNSRLSRELKQQMHFDVRLPIIFVDFNFVSLCGLFYICPKRLLVPVNVCVLLDLSVVCVEGVGEVRFHLLEGIFFFYELTWILPLDLTD